MGGFESSNQNTYIEVPIEMNQQGLLSLGSASIPAQRRKVPFVLPLLALLFSTFFVSFNLMYFLNQRQSAQSTAVLGVTTNNIVLPTIRATNDNGSYEATILSKITKLNIEVSNLETYKQTLTETHNQILDASSQNANTNDSTSYAALINTTTIEQTKLQAVISELKACEQKIQKNQQLTISDKLLILSP